MSKRCTTWISGVFLLFLLAGCAGLSSLVEVTTPTNLYTLSPKSTFSASLPQLKSQIVVDQPTATAMVDTNQIAVQPTPLQVQYLPEARWVDRAPLIVQALLIESFENSGRVPAVGSSAIGLRADYLVVTDIREFQAFVPQTSEPSALRVDVRLNIKIVDAFSDRIIASKSFEEIVASESDAATDVANAFDEALGDTMRDAVEWSIREIAKNVASQDRPT
ncbi:ABC-type transport auxiliary lipoprotein family protein [uncultured Tateyamaria sp.]|uniref:ABC-type transport auxiliary lipoprotein family protein n=1 Tax=uncultured Tateyamaria sp. TaxID=455651 RepID=UPI00261CD689|nr:ABC-type transport auxiliary lipoprotein family protein [uncultured Tateyamaria sp.]